MQKTHLEVKIMGGEDWSKMANNRPILFVNISTARCFDNRNSLIIMKNLSYSAIIHHPSFPVSAIAHWTVLIACIFHKMTSCPSRGSSKIMLICQGSLYRLFWLQMKHSQLIWTLSYSTAISFNLKTLLYHEVVISRCTWAIHAHKEWD